MTLGDDVKEVFVQKVDGLDATKDNSKDVVTGLKVLSKQANIIDELQKLGEIIKTKNDDKVTELVENFVSSVKEGQDSAVIQARTAALIESINANKTPEETWTRIQDTENPPGALPASE